MDAATADRALALLRMLGGMDDGCAIDQLDHALETATRAERVGADEEIVVAARFHDVGKLTGDDNVRAGATSRGSGWPRASSTSGTS